MPWSLNARLHFFACEFLWCIHSLYLYLMEEVVSTDEISVLYLRWSGSHEQLAGWALDERNYPLDREKAKLEEEKGLFSAADNLAYDLISQWGEELRLGSLAAYKKCPVISETMWLYYYYCRFLMQVLKEFEQLVLKLNGSDGYYRRFQEHNALFDNVRNAIQNDRPLLDRPDDLSQAMMDEVLIDMDAFAARLGEEWRQAVYSAARSLKP